MSIEREFELNIKKKRRELIKQLDDSKNKESFKYIHSDAFFNLGLSMYSENNNFDSAIFSAFSASIIDDKISLHPEQIRVIKAIYSNDAVVISAPTSFGKTFCIFEYIAREKPQNVVLIVPTLALTREYLLVFAKDNAELFNEYKIHTSIDEEIHYDFVTSKNVFILTHDRATSLSSLDIIEQIDFLVVDEVYKLDPSMGDGDRTLVFNVAYARLAKKAKKYVLLAPFIGGIKNCDQLEKRPVFVKSIFSPVVNEIEYIPIEGPENRFSKCDELIEKSKNSKTLVYFPGPQDIERYVDIILSSKENVELNDTKIEFVKWAENEIHPDWSVVKAIKKGYVMHHGKLPQGVKEYLLSLFNSQTSENNILLCTSTLLEGVNTTAERLIITKPNKVAFNNGGKRFEAFDFYNLVGRTGRLNKYYVGYTLCLKEPDDQVFDEADAEVEISFELTERTKDVDIQLNAAGNNQEVLDYLREKGLSLEDYINEIGTPIRFEKFKTIRSNYENNLTQLKKALMGARGCDPYKIMNSIISLKGDPKRFGIVKQVVFAQNKCTKEVVDKVKSFESLKNASIDEVVAEVLKIKNSYLEHSFLVRCKIIKMFLKKENDSTSLINKIDNYFIKPIEEMYYLNAPYKKMLKSLGIYDTDIDKITNVIGIDYQDITELKDRLFRNKEKYFPNISFISKFAIESLF